MAKAIFPFVVVAAFFAGWLIGFNSHDCAGATAERSIRRAV
jgi:hypothetical protein